ncbi:MAG: hypothetical protein BGO12_07610 [Verrucomicrobia bacterium 61-8]|nr:cellulase family glycosylhydrolase [Verrucomicrobiota bacterium]OJV00954.1 MAG: hypothetical protein BGO12_07610 [Verrucomicrobia bacterium 61-8]
MKTQPFLRGTNISHWLSQSDRRGEERRDWFTPADIRIITDFGFDHIRLPIDEEQMWDESGRPEEAAFDCLENALDWAEAEGLGVILDLHILRGHCFGQMTEPKLFTDPAEESRFADMWRQLSARLASRSTDTLAYELMNEPVADNPADWNRVAAAAMRLVREREPERTILIGSNRWNSVFTLHELAIPDTERTLLTFHYYHPMLITHHQAPWSQEGRMYEGPIQYPGRPIADEYLSQVRPPEPTKFGALDFAELNKPFTRDNMVADFAGAIAVSRQTGCPLYCGEFGVVKYAPMPVREAWYRDIISVFEEYGIGWANWDYKGQFGIVDESRQSTGIAEAMLGCTVR